MVFYVSFLLLFTSYVFVVLVFVLHVISIRGSVRLSVRVTVLPFILRIRNHRKNRLYELQQKLCMVPLGDTTISPLRLVVFVIAVAFIVVFMFLMFFFSLASVHPSVRHSVRPSSNDET